MKKQVCVIGAGRFGTAVAQELYQSGHDVLAIDTDEAKIQELMGHVTYAVRADASNESVLKELDVADFDVAVVASPIEGIAPITRSHAAIGDGLYVTGKLGGSILGKHLTFAPRIQEARELAAALGSRVRAMMDISDGLSLDLSRLCEASEVGALLDAGLLGAVVSADAHRLAETDGRTPLDHALSDGEDFELLFAVRGPVGSFPIRVWPIGEVTESGLSIRGADGKIRELAPRGYQH